MERITNNLYQIRCDYGLTQKQLAEAVGLSSKTIISLEKERSQPTLLIAYRLSRYLKVPVEEIFQYEEG